MALASLWGWRISRDLPDPQDADLLLPRASLAAAENGYEGLRAALVAAKRLDPEWAPLAWDPARMASPEGQSVYRAIAEAVARPGFQFPAPGTEDPLLLELRSVAQLLDARALAQAEAGHLDAAFAEARLTVALGEQVATGDDVTLVGAMVGGRIQELGYARIRSLLEMPAATALTLSGWLQRLGDRPIPVEARHRVWAGEYQAFKTQFTNGMEQQREGVPFFMRGSPGGYFYQHNRTLAKIAESFRRHRDAAGVCGQELVEVEEEMRPVDYVRPNAVGEILSRVAAPAYRRYHEQFCGLEARRVGTRSVLALRAYRLDHGVYPAALTELVPDYLPALPRDPFDGEPLRYSGSALRVWSVGRDRVDAGGEPSGREGSELDEIALPLELQPEVVAELN